MLISLSFALFALGAASGPLGEHSVIQIILLILLFSAFLLRQRVTDEFKDHDHDTQNYPDRPFQKGVIGSKALISLGLVAIATEAAGAYFLSGSEKIIWYLPVVVYSALMAREFFIGSWLERHFTTYFILHEMIFIPLGVWLAIVLSDGFGIAEVVWVLAFTCVMSTIEIARKFEIRHDTNRTVVKDTYPAVWGEARTRNVLEILMLIVGIALAYVNSALILATISAIFVAVLGFVKTTSTNVRIIVAAHLIVLAVGAILV